MGDHHYNFYSPTCPLAGPALGMFGRKGQWDGLVELWFLWLMTRYGTNNYCFGCCEDELCAASTWHFHTKCYKCWYVCLLEGKLFWQLNPPEIQDLYLLLTGRFCLWLPRTFANKHTCSYLCVSRSVKILDGDAVNQTDGQEFAKPAAELSEAAAGGATVCVMMFRCFPCPSTFWYRLGQRRCPHFRWAAEWHSQIEKLEELINSCVVNISDWNSPPSRNIVAFLKGLNAQESISLQFFASSMRMLQQSYHIWYNYSTFTKF